MQGVSSSVCGLRTRLESHPVRRVVAVQELALLHFTASLLLFVFLLILSGCANPLAAGASGGGSARAGNACNPLASLLVPSATTIDLGIVPQGGREQETFSLTNAGTAPVAVARIETSCECLEIRLPRRVIGPSQKVLPQARLDLSKDPDFLGGLAIEVKGFTDSGEVAFGVVVEVTVRPVSEFASEEERL